MAEARPKLVFVYGRASGPSRRMEAFLAQILQHRHNHETFDVVRVCAETHPRFLTRLAVTAVPTLFAIEDGKIQVRLDAPKGRAQVRAALSPWLS